MTESAIPVKVNPDSNLSSHQVDLDKHRDGSNTAEAVVSIIYTIRAILIAQIASDPRLNITDYHQCGIKKRKCVPHYFPTNLTVFHRDCFSPDFVRIPVNRLQNRRDY
jgi:hypothetical protein